MEILTDPQIIVTGYQEFVKGLFAEFVKGCADAQIAKDPAAAEAEAERRFTTALRIVRAARIRAVAVAGNGGPNPMG